MKKGSMHCGAIRPLYQRARELRNNATHAEETLWGYLKTKPLGFKFRRQHPYSRYILDFYCHAVKLVIEVDGKVHERTDVKLNDEERQKVIEEDGMKFLRFSNEQILKSLEKVILEIEKLLAKKDGE